MIYGLHLKVRMLDMGGGGGGGKVGGWIAVSDSSRCWYAASWSERRQSPAGVWEGRWEVRRKPEGGERD